MQPRRSRNKFLILALFAVASTGGACSHDGNVDLDPGTDAGGDGSESDARGIDALAEAGNVDATVETGDAGSADSGNIDAPMDVAVIDSGAGDTGAGDAGVDATVDAADAGPVVPSSCAVPGDGLTNCGAGESCCTSPLVTGGIFSRSYDGNTFTNATFQATVADFRLDKYQITVGRFRKFVDAVVGGYTPPAGSGKHKHLNAGAGLAASGGGFETGWDTAWNTSLPGTKATWDSSAYLACDPTFGSWTSAVGANERRPIDCTNWQQAAAFCIWDGGFLPSEAEYNYAASGGSEQRVYPWSSPPSSVAVGDTHAVYCGGACLKTSNVGSKAPLGNGRYGQADLAGNVFEWVLDFYKLPYNETSCVNCAYVTPTTDRMARGGSFYHSAPYLLASDRNGFAPPMERTSIRGARCARAP